MARNLEIRYFAKKCIGQGNCMAISPSFFQPESEKSKYPLLLHSSSMGEDIHSRGVQCDKKTAEELIEAGRSCPVNAIQIIDKDTTEEIVHSSVQQDGMKEVMAHYDDATEFVLDKAGYFLIRVDRENSTIEVGFCNERNKLVFKVVGKKPIDIYTTILTKLKLEIRKDHAAYLGRELQKAYISLREHIGYVQDDELDFKKV